MVSPDFQEMYDRRFSDRVNDDMTFNEWKREFENWINPTDAYPDIVQHTEPSREQIRNLAEVYFDEVASQAVLEEIIYYNNLPQKRYRDPLTGQFAKNPYKELRGY